MNYLFPFLLYFKIDNKKEVIKKSNILRNIKEVMGNNYIFINNQIVQS